MPDDTYCIDASSLIKLKQDYPRKTFPTVWEKIEQLVNDGRLFAASEVFDEIKKDDVLGPWAKHRKRTMFRKLDVAQIAAAKTVVNRFPNLAKPGKFGPAADPFVVALAQVENQSFGSSLLSARRRCIVVTEEIGPHKIPGACTAFKVSCTNLVGLFDGEGWVFR